jgi:hypothetical protein
MNNKAGITITAVLFSGITFVAGGFNVTTLAAQSNQSTETGGSQGDKPQTEGPPLPFHTVEGYGGGAITPMAYLVNPGNQDRIWGKPAVAFSSVVLGHKNLQALTLTETVFGRLELGYGIDRLGLGTLPDDIEDATTVDIGKDEVWLHNFNARYLLFKEGKLPAVTAGVHFKANQGIEGIDDRLGGALGSIGYEKDHGVDLTLTASKTVVGSWTFSRPLILTGGLRNSSGGQVGLLGFGDDRATTFEGSVAVLPKDWLLVAYEYRQKSNPYDEIPGLVEDEDDWHAVDVSWIVSSHTTLVAGWGAFGNVTNEKENDTWWFQWKREF